jgi:hypothetical protein
MTRDGVEARIARNYVDTHDLEIPYEIYKFARELEKLEKGD